MAEDRSSEKREAERERIWRLVRERILHWASFRMERADAEELAQETMVLLAGKYAHLESACDLVPLAIATMKNKAREMWRRRKRHDQIEADPHAPALNPEEAAGLEEMQAKIMAAIETLGDRCRELFRLKLLGYTFPEIQDRMGVASLNTVYTWDYRCRAQLKERLRRKP